MKIRRHKAMKNTREKGIAIIMYAVVILCVALVVALYWHSSEIYRKQKAGFASSGIPEYSGQPYIEVNGNMPFFTDEEMKTDSFEEYSSLDMLGRCGVAYANLSKELMPTGAREDIGSIRPSGWVQAKYPGVVDSKPPYLFNRCHLIAYCLAAENANEKNLITGTRYMNVDGMLPFEEQVARYIDDSDNHVLYRVTPFFDGNDLVARGVLMEAYSVEDRGEGICFCVYCYNVQPGIRIDYRTGESKLF